jgi:flagellar protein FlgJ
MIPNASNYTDFQGFTELRRQAQQQSPEAIHEVAKKFESLFVQMMLKSMRDSVEEGELFNGEQEKLYRDMFDKQLSINIAEGQGIGLAKVIERQLSGQAGDGVAPNGRELSSYMRHPAYSFKPAAEVSAIQHPYSTDSEPLQAVEPGWQSPDEFLQAIWPHAVKAADELGVDAEVLMAQSALETGWGQHIRSFDNGQNSYSLFGIKADPRWQGESIGVSTLEFREGSMQREQARFRAYDSVGEAFGDYVDFIKSNPRYQKALEHGYDAGAYARELQQAGYATDPDYANTINRVRNSDLLQSQLSEIKNSGNRPLT